MPGRGRRLRGMGRGQGRGNSRRHRGNSRRQDERGNDLRRRRSNTRSRPSESPSIDTTDEREMSMDDVKSYFVGNVSCDHHYQAQEENRDKYAAAIVTMTESGVDIAQNARVRALAASWARKDHVFADSLISIRSHYTLAEVLKAVTLMDAGRAARVIEKKLKRLQCSKTKVSNKKIGALKSEHDNLLKLKPSVGSATGAVIKHIKQWVRSFTKPELEFFALHFPTEPWKKLADICHFNPEMDFPSLPWFLKFCYGERAPEDSIVSSCKDLTKGNVNELVQSFEIPFTHVKNWIRHLTDDSKKAIALREKIDTLLWYYEDLVCKSLDEVLLDRLGNGHSVTLATGKLMDRLLALKMIRDGIPTDPDKIYFEWDWDKFPEGPRQQTYTTDESKAPFLKHLIEIADKNISNIRLPLESPIVVMGDASASMEVAIKTSVIIAGILTRITSAKLVFFDEFTRDAPYLPTNMTQVLELALSTKADNCTAPAASLLPFYTNKEVVKTFIVVTDEGENEPCEGGFWFADLFDKYYKEVYPSKLVFISFLNQHTPGRMVRDLKEKGYKPMQFILDACKPDLTKLDHLIATLSLQTSDFDEQVKANEQAIKVHGLQSVFSSLQT